MPPVGYRKQVEAALPGTSEDIVARSGVMVSTVVRWIRIMRDAGECHIIGWRRTKGTGGAIKAVYAAGPGVDARCRLKRLPGALYNKRHRAKVAEDPERDIARLAKKKADYWTRRAKLQGDPLVSALFGRAK